MLLPLLALFAVSADIIAPCGSYAETIAAVKNKRNYDRVELCLRRALVRHLTDAATPGRVVALDLANLAAIAQLRGRTAEADALYVRALSVAAGCNYTNSVLLANAATFYQKNGDFDRAEALYRRLETIELRADWLDQHAALLRARQEYAGAVLAETQALGLRVKQALAVQSLAR